MTPGYVNKSQLALAIRALGPRSKPHEGSARFVRRTRFRHGRKFRAYSR